MTRGWFPACCALLLGLSLSACTRLYTLSDEWPASPQLQRYTSIHVGWLALDEERWQELGFPTREQWVLAIDALNRDAMRASFGALFALKKLAFAEHAADPLPPAIELSATFSDSVVERVQAGRSERIYLGTTIHLTDVTAGTEVYRVRILASPHCPRMKGEPRGLEDRLGRCLCNAIGFLASKFE